MKFFILLFIFINIYLSILSQIINGSVINKETQEPISYVSIGIIDKNGGVYADKDGQFEIEITDYKKNDSLRFSCIGYEPASYSLTQLIGEQDLKIYLDPKIINLEEVTISPIKYKSIELGNKTSHKHICICGIVDYESGILIRNNRKLYLDKLIFKISHECSKPPDSVLIRVNIYDTKNNFPYKLLINEPIYFLLSKELLGEKISLNLVDYEILLDCDFAVTIEVIKNFGKGQICFAGWIKGEQTILKYGKQGVWEIPADSKKKKIKLFQSMIVKARIIK